MTSPRSTYGGGYYSAFPDTPIYDSLVAERGTPQIAPIRVPAAYDTGNNNLPALPSSLPALPRPSQQSPSYGYPQAQQPSPLQQAPGRTSRSRRRRAATRPMPVSRCSSSVRRRAPATRRCAPRLPAPTRRRTRSRTTTSSTAVTDPARGVRACWHDDGMGNAELHSIHVHPVKAFRGQAPRQAVVEPWGLAGDRRWVLIDAGERSSHNASNRASRGPPPSCCPAAEFVCPRPAAPR